jgi:chromosome segregation ATPase
MILARLHLVELQDELRIREGEGDFEDGKSQARRKEAELRILLLEEELKKIDDRTESGKKLIERRVKMLKDRQEELRNEQDTLKKRKLEHIQALRPIRKGVYQAEETLRRLETRQARQREDFAEKRQALRTHLQQLEEITLRLEPVDRLRDVERKLDALRRDMSELRRFVERQNKELPKKP